MGQVLKRYRKLPKSPLFGLITALVVLSMSIMAGLRADANPMPTQTLSGTISTSQTLNPSFVYIVESGVAIESGATLTIPAGTIIKSKYRYGSFTVNAGGSLRVTGTSASPVHFTSIKDDTVGGDSNNDGNATSPSIEDYTRAILSNDGEVNVVFAKFRYFSNTAVDGFRTAGSIVVTDSTFDNGRIAISASAPTVKLYRNKFNNLSPDSIHGAVSVSGAQDLTKISLSGIDQNVFTGTNKFSRIISLGQVTLPSGKSWTHAGTSGATVQFVASNYINGIATIGTDASLILQSSWRTIELRGTLNIQKGVWVKHAGTGALEVLPEGKLNVSGDVTNPVHFTSLKDDTIGGDTNGDGNLSTPVIGESWNVASALGDVNLSHAKFSYFGSAVQGDMNSLTVTDSVFQDSYGALEVHGARTIILKRNTFKLQNDQSRTGVNLRSIPDISGVSLSGTDSNIFIGNQHQRTINITDSVLPGGKVLDISTEAGAIPRLSGDNVHIEGVLNLRPNAMMIISGSPAWTTAAKLKGTMNIYEGAVIKYTSSEGIMVSTGANLNIYGTPTSKVKFTSYADDTVGGDTNSDGSSSAPVMGEVGAMVHLGGGSVYMNHTEFKYASRGIIGQSDGGSLKVFDSTFQSSYKAIEAKVTNVKIYRNNFNVSPQERQSAVELRGVEDISRVGLSGSDQNFFTGPTSPSRFVEFYDSKLPADRALSVATSSGAKLRLAGDAMNIFGSLTMSNGTTLVLEGNRYSPHTPNVYGTITIQQGVIIKASNTTGFSVKNGGKVNLAGNSSNRVKIAHLYDDTVGGDTNGDGNATAPGQGTSGYMAFSVESGGELIATNVNTYHADRVLYQSGGVVNMNNVHSYGSWGFAEIGGGETSITNATIQGGNQGINVSSGHVILRGTISGQQDFAIHACSWGETRCAVDAAYVDWGTGGAPATGSVCGQVTVSPWVGGSASSNGLFTSKNCDNSPTPADQLSSSTQHFGQRMSVRGIDCGNGFEDACEAMRTAEQCLGAATALAASTSSFPLPDGNAYEQPAQWGNMLASNASAYIQSVEGPNPILSAAGFASQLLGALSTMMDVADAYGTCAP